MFHKIAGVSWLFLFLSSCRSLPQQEDMRTEVVRQPRLVVENPSPELMDFTLHLIEDQGTGEKFYAGLPQGKDRTYLMVRVCPRSQQSNCQEQEDATQYIPVRDTPQRLTQLPSKDIEVVAKPCYSSSPIRSNTDICGSWKRFYFQTQP
ncbi:MAG: hypothetical protein OXT67_03260 [Zetaproteobacteria bacterium]|nr:hypothetical protein [Zetaproteobacteria bacterium]